MDPRTPVLVGCGQIVQQEKDVGKAKSPLRLMEEAARLAATDTGIGDALWPAVDTVTSVRFVTDSPDSRNFPFGQYDNISADLAKLLDITPARFCYGPTGGNTPQYLINLSAEEIASGEQDVVLLAGAECLGSLMRALAQGRTLDWGSRFGAEKRMDIGSEREGVSAVEKRHKLNFPVNTYPLFENALRGQAGTSPEKHRQSIGRLMAPFTRVAAGHPQAWFPVERSAEDIATVSDTNRYIGFPYTKYMNAIIQVDQAACIVMMSVQKARELGVPQKKWVFLHGCADANDIWYVTERQDFYSSPAIRTMGQKALEMAGWSIGEVDYLDLYSCFPSMVQIGRNELGIAQDDPRLLTVTGGLPYFGGAGNNYVMHSVATMMDKLRARPGTKGLCTANGWYVTKHGAGLYSTLPKEGRWERENPARYQARIDSAPHPVVEERPHGTARIETYTVMHDRNGPQFGIVMGRLDSAQARFVAHVTDAEDVHSLMAQDPLGRPGKVTYEEDGLNLFRLS